MMDLSVVIPVRNVGDLLAEQLDALVRQQHDDPWEIVVADNGSDDGRTLAIAKSYERVHRRLRVVDAATPPGRAAAINAGVDSARADRIAVCDGDDIVAPGWVTSMAEALRHHPFVCGPLDYRRLNKPWTIAARAGALQENGPLYVPGGPPWPYAVGANVGVQRKWHQEVGGYDETFICGGEDCDYAWKLAVKGVSVRWVPDALVHYRTRRRIEDIYRQARSYSESHMWLTGRWHDAWPTPPERPSTADLVRKGLRFAPAIRSRRGLGFWCATMGWSAGLRRGAAASPLGALPAQHFDPQAITRALDL